MQNSQMTDEELQKQAKTPKVIEIDRRRVEQHSLQDQIAMDRYLASKNAVKRRGSGLKFTKMQASSAE